MIDKAINVLKIIEDNGFSAYLVGGCVRDFLLGKQIFDIDICTSAKPTDLYKIFGNNIIINSSRYGSVVLDYEDIKCEITTYREEIEYSDYRHPDEVKFVEDLAVDLKRRDFTINTICMDKNRNIIDLFNGVSDLNSKIIKCVGDVSYKFGQDALRMLRAVRFATVLDFDLSIDVKNEIIRSCDKLKYISYERKKEELDKIFLSSSRNVGVKLLISTGMYKALELFNLKDIVLIDDVIGIWAQIRNDKYPFKKHEKKQIKLINYIIDNNIDIMNNFSLYKYGIDICGVVCKIKNYNLSFLEDLYNKLPISSILDINISTDDIVRELDVSGIEIGNIYDDIVNEILSSRLCNERNKIILYLKEKYMIK